MNENFNSFIRFKTFRVNNIYFKLNNDYKGDKEIKVDTRFIIDHVYLSNQNDQVDVTIACELFNDNFQDSGDPFYLNLSITGAFEVNPEVVLKDTVSPETIENTMKANTLAILFPYVRSIITTITSTANITPVILPPVNTNKLLHAKQ